MAILQDVQSSGGGGVTPPGPGGSRPGMGERRSRCQTNARDTALYDSLIRISADDEYGACFCERSADGHHVCGWDPRYKKSLLRVHEKESKKSASSSSTSYSSSSSSSYGVSMATAQWHNVKSHIPGTTRPWMSRGGKGDAGGEGGETDYVFKHREDGGGEGYMEDYRRKHRVGAGSTLSLGSGNTPDPYISKLKNCGDIIERLKRLAVLERQRKHDRVLTPTVVRNKNANAAHIDLTNASRMPIDGLQSLSLGLSSRRSPANTSRGHGSSSSNHGNTQSLSSRGGTNYSPVSSVSSDDCKEQSRAPDSVERPSRNSVLHSHSHGHVSERVSKSRERRRRSRTPQGGETNLPVAEIHFGDAPIKNKTWSAGSGQYLNLSFPKTSFPLPVRVALTPSGYSADGKDTPTRGKSRDVVNLTPNPRSTASRGSQRVVTPKGLYTENGRRRAQTQSAPPTNCGGAIAKKLNDRTHTVMGPKIPS